MSEKEESKTPLYSTPGISECYLMALRIFGWLIFLVSIIAGIVMLEEEEEHVWIFLGIATMINGLIIFVLFQSVASIGKNVIDIKA
mgnify:CR=1 FL=1